MNLLKKIRYIQKTILEIMAQLNLSVNKEPNFKNLATILHDNNLINEKYYQEIIKLDSVDNRELEGSKSLNIVLNDIQLYLEMQFYHYI